MSISTYARTYARTYTYNKKDTITDRDKGVLQPHSLTWRQTASDSSSTPPPVQELYLDAAALDTGCYLTTCHCAIVTNISIIASINLLAMAAERVRPEVARCVEVIGRDAGTSYAWTKTSCSVLVEDMALWVDQTDGRRRHRSRRSYTTAFCVCHEHKAVDFNSEPSVQEFHIIICVRGSGLTSFVRISIFPVFRLEKRTS